MYKNNSIAVVIPAKNEGTQIKKVITTLPEIVDKVFVIDDGSKDNTSAIVRELMVRDKRFLLMRNECSKGVGGAIADGYAKAKEEKCNVTVVMAGDGQMDPSDFITVISPVVEGFADYCKGNRFTYSMGLSKIPNKRLFGNFILSVLTKIVSGYWHISDSQTGYTAINLNALNSIDIKNIYPFYGCPNDILISLNIANMRVIEVPVHPLYNVREKSKMKIKKVIGPISIVLVKGFFRRMVQKYIIQGGHPLLFAYFFAFLMLLITGSLGLYIILKFILLGTIMKAALIAASFSGIVGIQLLLNAFNMDCDANKHLCIIKFIR